MHLFIDASNLRKGGGVTHLEELLAVLEPNRFAIERITVWAPSETAKRIGLNDRVHFRTHYLIDRGGLWAQLFRKYLLDSYIESDVDLLWAPGGVYTGKFRPYVTMVRNFLPFFKEECDRFKYSTNWLRLRWLRRNQLKSFVNATGLIHLSQTSLAVMNKIADFGQTRQEVIPHGLNNKFLIRPRRQREVEEFSDTNPVKLLYVSTIYNYKHQDNLIKALISLRRKGLPVVVDFVGAQYIPYMRYLKELVKRADPNFTYFRFHNEVRYEGIEQFYKEADLFVFLSSCETFGMALLEAMASGLPVLCSNKSALPEISGGTCPEVDPEDVNAIAAGLDQMIRNRALREKSAWAAYERAKTFSWEKCAEATFSFLAECAKTQTK